MVPGPCYGCGIGHYEEGACSYAPCVFPCGPSLWFRERPWENGVGEIAYKAICLQRKRLAWRVLRIRMWFVQLLVRAATRERRRWKAVFQAMRMREEARSLRVRLEPRVVDLTALGSGTKANPLKRPRWE